MSRFGFFSIAIFAVSFLALTTAASAGSRGNGHGMGHGKPSKPTMYFMQPGNGAGWGMRGPSAKEATPNIKPAKWAMTDRGVGRQGRAVGQGGGVIFFARPGDALPFTFRQVLLDDESCLPPGLEMIFDRDGALPPGLEHHIDRTGTLPPGLAKRNC